jgi:hypothetical protein
MKICLVSVLMFSAQLWANPTTIADESIDFQIRRGTISCRTDSEHHNAKLLGLDLGNGISGKSDSSKNMSTNITKAQSLETTTTYCKDGQERSLEGEPATAHRTVVDYFTEYDQQCRRVLFEELIVSVTPTNKPAINFYGQNVFVVGLADKSLCTR